MKKILLFTSLLIASRSLLNADLLNGPYSPESQELVKLAQNPTMPIPDTFKDQKKEIGSLRVFANINSLDPEIMMEMGRDLLKAPYSFHEAIIQMLASFKSTIAQDDMNITRYSPLTINELFLFCTAVYAFKIDNEDLFKLTLKNATQKTKDAFLGFLVNEASFRRPSGAYLQQFKKYIKLVIQLDANPNGDFNDTMSPSKQIIQHYFPSISNPEKRDPILELLLQNGLNINTVFYTKSVEKQQTLLDSLIGTSNLVPKNQELKDLIEYVKSKGAKTYAELMNKKA